MRMALHLPVHVQALHWMQRMMQVLAAALTMR